MEFKDYYKILGIKANADIKAIKAAYRKLAHKFHPDMNSDANAGSKFKEIAEAYQVLKDPQLRADFDELRQYGGQSKQGFQPPPGWQSSHARGHQQASPFGSDFSDFSDFFNSIFGNQGQSVHQSEFQHSHSSRGQDLEIDLPIFLEETLSECKKPIEFILPADGFSQTEALKKHLNVTIPQGVMDGERIRLKGQGKPGYKGGAAGDLYLHIRLVPHPLFDVQACNIMLTLPLAPWEAALGAKVTIPTLEGKITLTIPANSQSGDKLRVKARGLKTKGHRGDLFVIVKVVMPEISSRKAKLLWQQLATDAHFDPRKEWSTSL